MKPLREFLLFTGLFFVVVGSFAQDISFSSYSINEGLSQSVINCLYQDSRGFLWLGTQSGANRFDGYTFLSSLHHPSDTSTISDNWIYDIQEDNDGNLWFATKNGISKYDISTGLFTRYNHKPNDETGNYHNAVYGLATDANGNIWINAPPMLSHLNTATNEIEHFQNTIPYDGAVNDQNVPVFVDNEGLIWAGTTNGLACFDPGKKTFTNYFHNAANPESISSNNISAIYQDSHSNLWFGTASGLNRYNSENKTFELFSSECELTILNDKFIRAITEDSNGKLWVGTESGLYAVTSPNSRCPKLQYFNSQNSNISNDIVLSLHIDHSDNLWVGTLQGINKTNLKPKKFRLYRNDNTDNSVNLLDNVIASLYKARNGIIWVGNWGRGLNLYNRQTGEVEHFSSTNTGNYYIPDDYVHVIFEDNQTNIWLGTRKGLLVYDENQHGFLRPDEYFQNKALQNFESYRIYEIIQSQKGDFWIATQHGIFSFDTESGTTATFNADSPEEPRLSGNLVYDIIEDSEGLIWVATSSGLNRYNPSKNTFKHFAYSHNAVNGLCDNFTIALCEDHEGNIWIGTQTGVNKYVKSKELFEYYSQQDGLSNNLVYEILLDDANQLWFGTQNGLCRFNPETNRFRRFRVEDGLQSMEFNLKAKYKSPDGEIFFGGMRGFNSFYIDSLSQNTYQPPIVITRIQKSTNGETYTLYYSENEEIVFDYNDYEITIEFAALDYTNPRLNRYAYKMDKINKDWTMIENRHFVSFPKIPPGNYQFQVIGSNSDGVWNKEGTTLKIKVLPPWWQTTTAYVSYGIGFLLLVFGFIKWREKQLVKEKQILEEKVAERTQEIEKQKSKIEHAHRKITDSINYASRIQSAMLPPQQHFTDHFADSFVYFKPREVVSGDFYWLRKIRNYLVFAAADCTGHGVPGAFVSMLGISLLNENIRRHEVQYANQLLEILRQQIKNSLQQSEKSKTATKDGMDIALCVYNTETRILQFAGANNPLYLIRNKNGAPDLQIFKPTKNPIGIYRKEKEFIQHEFQVESGDCIYLFSDGYVDQFGGERKEKFKFRRFKSLLLEISGLPMNEQYEILDSNFQNWKKDLQQLDDILVIGLRF